MRTRFLPVLAGLLFTAGAVPAGAQTPTFRVVAHPGVVGNAVSRAALSDIFLGRLVRWGDGQTITPVDQSMTSAVRAQFSEKGLGQNTMAINHHWMRQIQSGRRPPIVKNTDADVIAYVASHPGAIGYVGAETLIPDTVKVLEIK
jgi:ABC-type phosphate transport system substrate-binding protein